MLTNDRLLELAELRQLLQSAQKLNAATGALDRLEELQASAARLSATTLGEGRLSFVPFMWEALAVAAGNWPKSRQGELNEVVALVATARSLETATGVLTKLRTIQRSAEQLLQADLDNNVPSFMEFLASELRNLPAK